MGLLDKNKKVLVSNDWGKLGRKLEETFMGSSYATRVSS